MPKAPATVVDVNPLYQKLPRLTRLFELLQPVPDEWLKTDGKGYGSKSNGYVSSNLIPCKEYKALQMAWRRAFKWTEGLDRALVVMLATVTSTKSVGDSLWVKVMGPASCGKSSLCEAVSMNEEYVLAKSTLRGFHSGWRGDEDSGGSPSLIDLIRDKTFVIKDGDTLIQQPNLKQILSEARDIFDKVSRTHYRNAVSREHTGINMSWILCGTASLRILDSSELGQRFLDCVIMEGIDDDLEDEILWRVANRTDRTVGMESNGDIESQHEPDMLEAMRITGGYVSYLRENATALLSALESPDWAKKRCARLGKFVAYMRARPSKMQDESSEREFAARLVSQHVRLMKCTAVVLNKKTIDEEVMSIVTHVALDTSRGSTLDIVRSLYKSADGMEVRAIALLTNRTEDDTRKTLRYLRHIGVIEINTAPLPKTGAKTKMARWILTSRIRRLYEDVMTQAIRSSEAV